MPNGKVPPIVDEEFKTLLPALSPDQLSGLEKLILENGRRITDPLKVWLETGILLDGHNRMEIAARHGLIYETVNLSFKSRESAVEWIFANQRDRRNLTPEQLALVMGRHYNHLKGPGHGVKNPAATAGTGKQTQPTGRLYDRLSAEYGVGHSAVIAAGKYAAAVETLKTVDPEIEQKVVTGKGPTRKAVIAAAAEPDPEKAKAILSGTTSPAPKPKEENPTQGKKVTNSPPSDGMRIARSAAGKLNEIRVDDTERSEAFAFMRRWINAHEA